MQERVITYLVRSGNRCGDGLNVGCDISKSKSTDHDGHLNGEDLRQANGPIDQEAGAHPERESVVEVNEEKKKANHGSSNGFDLESGCFCLDEMGVILASQLVLGVECCRVPDGANDLFRNSTAFGILSNRLFVEFGNEFADRAQGDDNGRHGRTQDQGELPIPDEANDKGSDKGGNCSQGQANLFRNTVLNKIGVCCDACGDLTSTQLVEKGNVLSEDGGQELLSDLGRDVFTSIQKACSGHVNHDVFSNRKIDKVQGVLAEFAVELTPSLFIGKELLESARKTTK